MPQIKSHILKSPIEKSIKFSSTSEHLRYSKNVANLSEKKIQANRIPNSSKKCQKLYFNIEPSQRYISFRNDCNISINAKVLVSCTDLETSVSKTFHLKESLMNIYLNSGFIKFINNVKCTFNHVLTLDSSTLSFQDFNVMELYHNIETSFLKSSDEFKKTNLLINKICTQFELDSLKPPSTPVIGDLAEASDVTSSRLWTSSLPLFPFRNVPPYYKNRLNSATPENLHLATVNIYKALKYSHFLKTKLKH